jgi:hypothetical protein
MRVSGVVVDDRVDDLAGGNRAFDRVEEANELLVPVALHAAADHRALQHIQGSDQRCRAVALVVVRHRDGKQPLTVVGTDFDTDTGAYAPDSHATSRRWKRKRTLPLGVYPLAVR